MTYTVAFVRTHFSFPHAPKTETFLPLNRPHYLSDQFLFEFRLLKLGDSSLYEIQVERFKTSRYWPDVERIQTVKKMAGLSNIGMVHWLLIAFSYKAVSEEPSQDAVKPRRKLK